ncbi:hypothetical protein E4Z66_03340 [Aliishimia ponticola]|uniref:DNA methylase N-4/N-6 domain-containing protein n=1 Tax=Aliishimia ponticola TaxID=2499833 RepID=A0A4S4NG48_9RHOB|nr:DNA methyltransferase [Aliishimia ponticola]THH38616.1 hypothetical protein E4Z66_03340 [Aliishimia ponticola]
METTTNFRELQWGAEIQLPNSRALSKSPHFVGGRYPCRSVAYVPRMILEDYSSNSNGIKVLDPFMGSGTTAIEAVRYANSVHGVEVDPYARLIATVATRKYSSHEIQEMQSLVSEIEKRVQKQKPNIALKPELANIDYWFDDVNFADLLKLKSTIFDLTDEGKIRDFLLAAFGDIIRACSKAERQSLKPYISKKYEKTPKPVMEEFSRIAPKYIDAVLETGKHKFDGIVWEGWDATDFDVSTSIDLAITSPPYINAMDYTRCIKLESAWIGTADDQAIRTVRNAQLGESIRRHRVIGDEFVSSLARKHFGELEAIDESRYKTALVFFDDMKRNLQSVFQALKSGGSYYIIIGNSKIRDIDVPTHQVIAEIAGELGYNWEKYFLYRIKDHRTSIPRGDRGGKIEFEHVLGLVKP